MDDRRTWYSHWGLVGWNYRPMARSNGRLIRLDLEESETRRRWLCELVGRLPALVDDFGYLTEVSADTPRLERACVVDWRNQEGRSALLSFLQQAPQVDGLDAVLNLTCLDRDLNPMEIPAGAYVRITIWLTDSGALDHRTDAPVYLRLGLNDDIYAPRSIGEIQNNTLLAALNGPRLAGILERIERDVPAELMAIDQDRHPPGTVGPRGFIAPPGVLKDA